MLINITQSFIFLFQVIIHKSKLYNIKIIFVTPNKDYFKSRLHALLRNLMSGAKTAKVVDVTKLTNSPPTKLLFSLNNFPSYMLPLFLTFTTSFQMLNNIKF